MSYEKAFLVTFEGELDGSHLDALCAALGMRRRGRLTDWQDTEFGRRYVRDETAGQALLTLDRHSAAEWTVELLADAPVAPSHSEISALIAEIKAAAASVGLRPIREIVFDTVPAASATSRTGRALIPAETAEIQGSPLAEPRPDAAT